MLQKLYIIRHGDYGMGGGLIESGQQQAEKMGGKLKERCEDPLIIHSPVRRTLQHAETLAQILGCKIEESGILESSPKILTQPGKVLDLLREAEKKAPSIILVTHYEYCKEFPFYFGKHWLGVDHFPAYEGLVRGAGWEILCEEKECNLLYPL